MTVLLKSQNGKQIINLDNCTSIGITGDNNIIAFYPLYDGWDKIGEYSSNKKAQKALDWILDSYNMNLLLKATPKLNPRDFFDEYVADQKFGIFEMPSDEEVEV